ncbi:MAG: zf-HC2 domain-containing protein [Planctomycetota bacterium]
MFNCRKISELVSRSLDGDLSFWKRVQIRMHMMMCSLCRKFRRALLRIDGEVRNAAEQEFVADENVVLPESRREQIKELIESGQD